jgi:hypothetical protein
MRLFYLASVLFIAYIIIGLLNQTLQSDLRPIGVTSEPSNFIYDIFIQPNLWNLNGESGFSTLIGIFGGLTAVAVGIAVAATVFGRSDIAVLAIPAGIFLSLGAMPILSIYQFLIRNIGSMACNISPQAAIISTSSCLPASLIGTLVAGTLGLLWVLIILEWWLWRPLTA